MQINSKLSYYSRPMACQAFQWLKYLSVGYLEQNDVFLFQLTKGLETQSSFVARLLTHGVTFSFSALTVNKTVENHKQRKL